MFGQVLDKLDTYFGRTFVLARYVPWLLCAGANIVFACLEFPAVRSLIGEAYKDAAGKAVDLVVALLAIWVLAYVTSPLVQFVTRFLEGAWMPGWLARLIIVTHAVRRDQLEAEYRLRFARRATVPDSSAVIDALRSDRSVGARHRKIGDEAAITRANAFIARLRVRRWLNQPIELDEFQRANAALSEALKRNCAEPQWFLDMRDKENATILRDLHEEMWRTLAPYALDIAEQIEDRAYGKRERLFADKELAPTRLGNDAAALRGYCETRYGIEFDFFWPRFLLVVLKDAKLSDAMVIAKIQLDFSILALALTAVTVAVWSLLLAILGTSLWAALLVVAVGPLAVYAWLGIVHASYASFAELVRSAIDLHRFELLSALRRPLPASSDAEKRSWEAVTRLGVLNEHRDNVAFKHPTT